MQSPVIVLADLTALFSTREKFRKNINYKVVDSFVKEKMGVNDFAEDSIFWTLYSQNNEGQNNFINFLKTELNWNVEGIKTTDIRRGVDYKQYRFDSKITYELGILFQPPTLTRILVISDSYELAEPMIEVAKQAETEVSLGFFADALDGRWINVLKNPENRINLLDFCDMQDYKVSITQE